MELLVVIVIVAVLASVTVMAVAGALDRSKQAACASNLRSIGVGLHLYAGDHNGVFPETSHTTDLQRAWIFQLKDYLGDFESTRICPADPQGVRRLAEKGTSYILNSYLFVPPVDPFGDPTAGAQPPFRDPRPREYGDGLHMLGPLTGRPETTTPIPSGGTPGRQ